MHLGELVASTAARTPNKPAIIFRDQVMTYAQLDQRVNQVANGLTAMGVKKVDRVGLYLHNVPLFIESYYGIQRIGATVVPLNPLYKPAEIAFILNDCGAKAVVTLGMFYPNIAAARQEIRSLQHAITDSANPMAGATPVKQAFDTAPATPLTTDIQPDDIAVICYTSGTTGKPKGAMLTHRNFISNCTQMNSAPHVSLTSDDIVWVGLPLFHIYAMNTAMNLAVMTGSTMVLMERFDPAASMEMIARNHVTIVPGAPPMYIAWANLPNVRETYDLSSLRYCGSGAAALPVQVLENFKAATGVDIAEGYGLTEAAPVITTNAAGPVVKPGSVGPAVSGVEVRLVDPATGRDVPVGEIGELIARGANIMAGYYNRPEATAEALQDGWLHTGDLATMDNDGYYYIVDRLKDMINVSGYNVYPREVEEMLFRHPAVADAAVVQAPDSYQGESVFAFVVLKPDATATEADLIEYCRNSLAVFKAPKRIAFRDTLPKNNTGKVLRRELRDEAAQIVRV